MSEGTVVVRRKGKELPHLFLEKVLATHGNVLGYATTMDGAVILQANPESSPLENIQSMLREIDTDFLMFFGKTEGKESPDLQPYILLKDGENVLIAASIEGTFSKPDVIQDIVTPRLQELYELVDGDMSKLWAHLDKDIIKKEFQGVIEGHGVIALISDQPGIKLFSTDGSLHAFDWGVTSKTHGYGEKVYPEKKPEEPVAKELSLADKMKNMLAGKKATPVASAAPTVLENKAPISAAVKETLKETVADTKQVPTSSVLPTRTFKLPPEWKSWTNRDKKTWMNKTMGSQPQGWKKWIGPDVTIPWVQIGAKLEAAPAVEPAKPVEAPPKPQEAPAREEFQKDVKPKEVKPEHVAPAGAASSVPSIKASDLPVIPPTQRKAFRDTFMNSVDFKALLQAGAAPQLSLDELKELEKKLPNFSDQTGMDLDTACRLPYPLMLSMVRGYDQAAATLLTTLAFEYVKAKSSKSKAEAPVTQETVAEEVQQPKKSKVKWGS